MVAIIIICYIFSILILKQVFIFVWTLNGFSVDDLDIQLGAHLLRRSRIHLFSGSVVISMASSEASSSSTHISVCYRGHRRRKQSSSPFFTTPSSKLLSLLASLVSASTVDASPVPPPFLCPSIGLDNILQSPSLEKRSPPPGNEQQGNPPTSKRVPDKFERGLDGLWVRVPYTLYGVTTPDPNCNNEV